MSLLSNIAKFVGRVGKKVAPIASTVSQLAAAAVNPLPVGFSGVSDRTLYGAPKGGGTSPLAALLPPPMGFTGNLPALPGTGFRTGGGFPAPIKTQAPTIDASAGMCPRGYHLAKDGSGRLVRNRRMNPYNPQAARRAVRRIKALRRGMQRIERSLPTRTVHRRK